MARTVRTGIPTTRISTRPLLSLWVVLLLAGVQVGMVAMADGQAMWQVLPDWPVDAPVQQEAVEVRISVPPTAVILPMQMVVQE